MKKYLGSKMTAFAAFVVPVFILGPILFSVCVLCSEISAATVFLAIGLIACSIVWGFYLKIIGNQLYSWGVFSSDCVWIKTIFSKSSKIEYEKCKGCGIGYYIHGVLNSQVGSKIYFIYLSYEMFDESLRSRINLWKPSQTRIKVEFSPKLYEYLLTVLPQKQSQMLSRDYKKYFG